MAKKSLGQHWLNDRAALEAIVAAADLAASETVLEIGPGLGSLTRKLVKSCGRVIAVELDRELAERLKIEIQADNLQITQADILDFDLRQLPVGYKVVANIPYYLTGKLMRLLAGSANPPSRMVLLVQKEVAQRIVAQPGAMNLLALSVQLNYEPMLGRVVERDLFSPPPKVDSQIVILEKRSQPLFNDLDEKRFFRLVRAGFSEKRKMLRSSLAGGLGVDKTVIDEKLERADIPSDARAQELSLHDWHRLYSKVY